MQKQNIYAHGWILIQTLIISFGILAGLFLFNQTLVAAHGVETATANSDETVVVDTTGDQDIAIVPDSYNYIVAPNDNMSILVRRSVTLYDEGNDSVELTETQVIFVETNVVQEMGPRLLDVHEEFEVSRLLIEKYVAQTADLSEATEQAWGGYAKSATFILNDITPTNVPLSDDGSLDTDYTAPVVQKETVQQPAESSSTPAYWWLIGLVAIAGLTFILMPNQNQKTDKK